MLSKKIRSFLSILITLTVVVLLSWGSSDLSAFAQDINISPAQPTGTGTQVDPYIISSAGNLEWISEYSEGSAGFANQCFKQTINIDLAGYEWIPIKNFQGTYDGNGKTISNMTIQSNLNELMNGGLFGDIRDATIKNLGIVDIDFFSYGSSCGGLVSVMNGNNIIEKCYVTGNISAVNDVGGLVGLAGGSKFGTATKIDNCYTNITLNSTGCAVGGLIGHAGSTETAIEITNSHSLGTINSTGALDIGGLIGGTLGNGTSIRNCYSSCNINSSGRAIGGLIGRSSGELSNCYATGEVKGGTISSDDIGGLIGENNSNGGIRNCYATGNVSGYTFIGGLIGINNGPITSCFATGAVQGDSSVGGLAGRTYSYERVKSCYYVDGHGTNGIGAISVNAGTIETCVQQTDLNFYKSKGNYLNYSNWDATNSWDFGAIWNINSQINNGYPYLVSESIVNNSISGKDSAESLSSYTNINYGTLGTPIAEPIDSATGAHVLDRNIFTLNGARDLSFDIHYNSLLINSGSMGRAWTHDYGAFLELLDASTIKIHWSPNRANTFIDNGQNHYTCSDQSMKHVILNKNQDGSYTLTRNDQSQYLFNPSGALTELKNSHGQALNLTYNGTNRLEKITEPISGQTITFSYNADSLISTITDTSGKKVYLTYDSSQNLTGITDASGKTTTYAYDVSGQVLTGTNAEGVQFFSNTYDDNGRVVAQFDGIEGHLNGTFSYDESTQPGNLLTTYTNREGKTSKYIYDSKYNLISYTDELNNITSYTYDGDGNCTSKTYADGTTIHYSHDTLGNILTVTDPAGHITTMTYDGKNNLLTSENSEGKKITYTYDANNNLTRITDPLGNNTDLGYDANGLLISKITSGANATTFTYQNGLVKTTTDPTGVVTSYSYDTAGELTAQADALGKTTQYSHDASNNLTSITDPLGNITNFAYDSHGNILTVTDPEGNNTHYIYNSNQKLISKVDPLNHETRYDYDGEDRLITTTDPRGNATTITYDAKGQYVSVTDALGHSTKIQYDSVGNVTGNKGALDQQILSLSYDSNGNPTVSTDALGNSINMEYDKLNRLNKSNNPKGQITQYSYDDLNRLTTVNEPLQNSSTQAFDAEGNRVSLSDPNKNQTIFTYDTAGRKLSEKTADGSEIKYSYSSRGLLAQKTNGRGQVTTYQYDDAGRMTSYTDPIGTVSLTLDANGNILTIQDSNGTITRKYDALNRVTQYTDVWGNIIYYNYDSIGNLITLTYPGNKAVNYEYDAVNRLVKVTDWASRVTNYEYDSNNRLTKTLRPDGSIETRQYDAKGQLTHSEDKAAEGTMISKYDYTYDEVGNIIEETSAIVKATSIPTEDTIMVYGAGNRLISYNGQIVEYDNDGNMTTGPQKGKMETFTYDARNRLIGVGNTAYLYDAQNNRVGLNQGGVLTRYVVNPSATLSQVLMETDDLGAPKAYYVYGVGLLGKQEAQGGLYSYHYDYRGSTVALTDNDGKISDSYAYDAYGKINVISGSTPNPYKYNGRDGVITDDNGLYYMRARFYNPEIKRFANQDIVIGSIMEDQTLNRFAYVNGQPVNYVDPFGLSRDSSFVRDKTNLNSGYVDNTYTSIQRVEIMLKSPLTTFTPVKGNRKGIYEWLSKKVERLILPSYKEWEDKQVLDSMNKINDAKRDLNIIGKINGFKYDEPTQEQNIDMLADDIKNKSYQDTINKNTGLDLNLFPLFKQ